MICYVFFVFSTYLDHWVFSLEINPSTRCTNLQKASSPSYGEHFA
ncbi:hypothetical protein [uncultured Gammaproteobacteria bacterium]|nr:hypothetical protein [uncultured Gammaproteobacteria bacterium]CAC9559259.1 hypothetical protein [uncultured Gammaproteobacteria bacterium]CAC9563923.1 hypothetical protein [uncultured Gammaproteobacteria bacterium]CAC9585561.1 hypothetical protein [uncultured Gammaproteobacteria bacterium]CAC9595014.1 hypothetical protein [uncultured Gammaproteobacteria bacterium]